jgi:hypothetical protein
VAILQCSKPMILERSSPSPALPSIFWMT